MAVTASTETNILRRITVLPFPIGRDNSVSARYHAGIPAFRERLTIVLNRPGRNMTRLARTHDIWRVGDRDRWSLGTCLVRVRVGLGPQADPSAAVSRPGREVSEIAVAAHGDLWKRLTATCGSVP